MNTYMQNKWSWIEGTHGMRAELLKELSDADLAFTPGGQNTMLGMLFRQLGEVEHSYVQSLRTFTQDWSYRNTTDGLDSSIAQLSAWYATLDAEMQSTASAFTDEELQKTVDRGGFNVTVDQQLDIYLQALLIFFGKAAVYLKALGKPLPKSMAEWID